MPESAARINPLRPRVCTIRLCLGEPPLRGARVRARLARSVFVPYVRTHTRSADVYVSPGARARVHIYTPPAYTRTRVHPDIGYPREARTYFLVGSRRAYGVMEARPLSSTPAATLSRRESRLETLGLSTTASPCSRISVRIG